MEEKPKYDVQIIFNDKFKSFIKKVQHSCCEEMKQIDYYLQHTNYVVISDVESLQQKIRKYIIKHQNEVEFAKPKKLREGTIWSYPEFFVIFISLLVNIDECDNFDDVMSKIRRHTKPTNASGDMEFGLYEEFHCACSHFCSAESLYRIDNIALGRSFLVGCDCIEKHKIVSPEIIKIMKREINHIRKSKKKIIDDFVLKSNMRMIRNIFNVLRKNTEKDCIMCKKVINKKMYYFNCRNETCDCKNKKLQRLYCWDCANIKFRSKYA